MCTCEHLKCKAEREMGGNVGVGDGGDDKWLYLHKIINFWVAWWMV